MEFSSDVLTGLSYLANGSHFSDENFKRIVNSSLGLLAGEQNIDRIQTICPEKGDIVRKSYTALLTFTLEVLRFSTDEEVKNILMKQNLKADRVDYYLKIFSLNKDSIVVGLRNCSTSWPNLIDANWRLDFIVKTNVQNHIAEPVYFIVLSTAKEGLVEHIKFTCNLHQLQELCTKLKEIADMKDKRMEREKEDPWNVLHLRGPPDCTVETIVKQAEILDLKGIISEASSTYLNDLKLFNVEAAFLARFLYRFKRVFRHDKSTHLLAQVNLAIKRFRGCHPMGPIKKLARCFPENIPPDGCKAYLPTGQMLTWLLFRLLANAKIFIRILDLCKKAGVYLYGKISMGWSISNMFFALAITSRIYTCVKFMLIKTIEWYDRLYVHSSHLVHTFSFMPNFELPKKMEDFLGHIDLSPPSKKADIDKIFELIDLTGGDENEEDDDIILMNEFINSVDLDDEIEITNDDVVIEKEKIQKKKIKRVRDADVSVIYEQIRPNLASLKNVEDLGEPLVKKKCCRYRDLKNRKGPKSKIYRKKN